MKEKMFYLYLQFLDFFFMDLDPDFWLIRIRTQEKKFDPDPELGKKVLPGSGKNPDPKTAIFQFFSFLFY